MINYKLTKDLVADCMALIPYNLEKLNRTSKDFEFKHQNNRSIFVYDLKNSYECYFCYLKSNYKFVFISHCLRTILNFQKPNLKYKSKPEVTHDIWSKWMSYFLNNSFDKKDYTRWGRQIKTPYKDLSRQEQASDKKVAKECFGDLYSNIASATLHGQGEYPPNTFEELCESYKDVMSKQI